MAVPAFGPLVVVEPRMEDEHAWTKLIAALEANIAHLDAQIAKESQHIRAELATLRDQRDAKRQELDVQIQSRIDSLNTTIANGRAALADGTDEAKAKLTAEIVTLENKRHAAWHQLEASWHAQQAEWHRDLTALREWASKASADAKASVDVQIAALEAKRMARQQEWDRRTHMASDAAQDLKTGADAARADLRQARKQAADEFK
jgi:predicted  nucleic acid-binding Zn-ribbon protein